MPISTELLHRLGTTGPALEKQLIQEVKKVFSTFVGMDHLLHLPLAVDPAESFSDCLSALIGFGGTYNGAVSLHASRDLARMIAAQLLANVEPTEEEIEDALGELANIIAGTVKPLLCTNSLDIRLATPSVVSGKRYVIHMTRKPDTMTLLFDSEDDWFIVALAVERN